MRSGDAPFAAARSPAVLLSVSPPALDAVAVVVVTGAADTGVTWAAAIFATVNSNIVGIKIFDTKYSKTKLLCI
jgi:hypothetical protein